MRRTLTGLFVTLPVCTDEVTGSCEVNFHLSELTLACLPWLAVHNSWQMFTQGATVFASGRLIEAIGRHCVCMEMNLKIVICNS